MTESGLEAFESYRRGLDAELDILETLVHLAAAQDAASEAGDAEGLLELLGRRDDALATLMDVEATLAARRADAAVWLDRLPACERKQFEAVRQRHRLAAERLSLIEGHDRRTLEHLGKTQDARRDSSQMLDAAEATLAAYRKALAPIQSRSGLLDRRG